MDLDDTPAEAAFRAECRAWLAANAPSRPSNAAADVTAVLGPGVDTPEALAAARAWQAAAADAGWAGIGWPREYGGRGASLAEQVIFDQEAARFQVPNQVFRVGVALGGPTLIVHGTPEQQARFLPPLQRGEEIWAQCFSEPGAGSDLGALRTTAVRDGDDWVVDGQKVWASGAHYSQWGMLLTRTDWDAPKHAGITYFLLDLAASGVEIRPLRQLTGGAHFNEVFLDGVRIPDAHRVGDVNDGWRVAQTTLLSERAAIAQLMGEDAGAAALVELARDADAEGRPGSADPCVRQELARVHTEAAILRYLGYRIVTAFSRGTLPGPEASVVKLAMGRFLRRQTDLALALLGPAAVTAPTDWQTAFLTAPALRIAGGSDEVQRNIIGERVLGLPKEPGPPRDVPFRDLVT